jgi:hypothetical protein
MTSASIEKVAQSGLPAIGLQNGDTMTSSGGACARATMVLVALYFVTRSISIFADTTFLDDLTGKQASPRR